MPFPKLFCSILLALAVAGSAAAQTPLGTHFSYQGQLRLLGAALDDTADLEFTLWDADVDGNQVGSLVAANDVLVVDGLFTVDLDFGAEAFNGNARWLEIAVRSPAGSGEFTTLNPRQPLSAVPYALQTRGLYTNAAGNRVGVGTTNPTAPLHVSGSTFPMILAQSTHTAGTWLRLLNNSTGGHNWNLISSGANNGEGPGNLLFNNQTMGGTRMIIQSGGNVGIGTTTPEERLHVNGTARVNAVRFPDGSLQESAAHLPIVFDVPLQEITVNAGAQTALNFVVEGAVPGMSVLITPPYDMFPGNFISTARVTNTDLVRMIIANPTTVTRVYAQDTWRVALLP